VGLDRAVRGIYECSSGLGNGLAWLVWGVLVLDRFLREHFYKWFVRSNELALQVS
jgi:hypothetical protein